MGVSSPSTVSVPVSSPAPNSTSARGRVRFVPTRFADAANTQSGRSRVVPASTLIAASSVPIPAFSAAIGWNSPISDRDFGNAQYRLKFLQTTLPELLKTDACPSGNWLTAASLSRSFLMSELDFWINEKFTSMRQGCAGHLALSCMLEALADAPFSIAGHSIVGCVLESLQELFTACSGASSLALLPTTRAPLCTIQVGFFALLSPEQYRFFFEFRGLDLALMVPFFSEYLASSSSSCEVFRRDGVSELAQRTQGCVTDLVVHGDRLPSMRYVKACLDQVMNGDDSALLPRDACAFLRSLRIESDLPPAEAREFLIHCAHFAQTTECLSPEFLLSCIPRPLLRCFAVWLTSARDLPVDIPPRLSDLEAAAQVSRLAGEFPLPSRLTARILLSVSSPTIFAWYAMLSAVDRSVYHEPDFINADNAARRGMVLGILVARRATATTRSLDPDLRACIAMCGGVHPSTTVDFAKLFPSLLLMSSSHALRLQRCSVPPPAALCVVDFSLAHFRDLPSPRDFGPPDALRWLRMVELPPSVCNACSRTFVPLHDAFRLSRSPTLAANSTVLAALERTSSNYLRSPEFLDCDTSEYFTSEKVTFEYSDDESEHAPLSPSPSFSSKRVAPPAVWPNQDKRFRANSPPAQTSSSTSSELPAATARQGRLASLFSGSQLDPTMAWLCAGASPDNLPWDPSLSPLVAGLSRVHYSTSLLAVGDEFVVLRFAPNVSSAFLQRPPSWSAIEMGALAVYTVTAVSASTLSATWLDCLLTAPTPSQPTFPATLVSLPLPSAMYPYRLIPTPLSSQSQSAPPPASFLPPSANTPAFISRPTPPLFTSSTQASTHARASQASVIDLSDSDQDSENHPSTQYLSEIRSFTDGAGNCFRTTAGKHLEQARHAFTLMNLAGSSRLDYLLKNSGNYVRYYNVEHLLPALYATFKAESVAVRGVADMSSGALRSPPYEQLVWFLLFREGHKAIADRVLMCHWTELALFDDSSVRLFHFLPGDRAQALPHNELLLPSDILLALEGLQTTYSALLGPEFGAIFQSFRLQLQSHGILAGLSPLYCENIIFAALSALRTAAHIEAPLQPPAHWIRALTDSFEQHLLESFYFSRGSTFDSSVQRRPYAVPHPFCPPIFTRAASASAPSTSNSTSNPRLPATSRSASRAAPTATPTSSVPNTPRDRSQLLCVMSLLRFYDLSVEAGGRNRVAGVPSPCRPNCPYMHADRYPSPFPRTSVLAAASEIAGKVLSASSFRTFQSKVNGDRRFA